MPGKRLGPSAASAIFVAVLMPALLLLLLWGALPARAAAFTVDDTADTHDADLDDGLCADADGACTLRAAVEQTNALEGHDTIVVPAGVYTLTLAGAGDDDNGGGDLDVLGNLTLTGAGAEATVIDANWADRALHLQAGHVLTVTGMTVRNGQATGGDGEHGGRGGGILNEGGTMFLSDVVLRGNTAAARYPDDGAGGAIYNLNGTLTLSYTLLEDNDAIEDDGGDALGGGVYNDGGRLFVYESAFLGNVSSAGRGFIASGGAVYNANGRVVVDGAYFALNSAQAWETASGGAVRNAGGTMTMTASTLRSNRSYNMDSTDGGGSYGGGLVNDAGSSLHLENGTLSENAASALVVSGDVYAGGLYNAGQAQLNNVTLYHNIREGVYNEGGLVTLANSVAAGSDAICVNVGEEGAVEDGGHNMLESEACGFPATGELMLGPLEDNGGPATPLGVIPTHALQNGSPALDAGHPAAPNSAANACAAADQRGVARPQDGEGDTVDRCDAGAYEADALPIVGLWLSGPPSTTIGARTRLRAGVEAGTNVVYTWDLGDGNAAHGRIISHTYAAVGTYTATITVSNGVNLLTATRTIAIRNVPIAGPVSVEVNAQTVDVGTACTFRARLRGGTGVTFAWDFDDGDTAEGRVVRHTFSAPGEYEVRMTASNGVSEATATRTVTVVEPVWVRLMPFVKSP